MEVVGAAASVTALITVSLQSLALATKVLRAIRDGPSEVRQLLESVQGLETALKDTLQATSGAENIPEYHLAKLHGISDCCTTTVRSLERRLISFCTKHADGKTVKAWKWIRILLSKEDLARMRDEVAHIYHQLVQWIGLVSFIKLDKVQTSLETFSQKFSSYNHTLDPNHSSDGTKMGENSNNEERLGPTLSISLGSPAAKLEPLNMLTAMKTNMENAQQSQINVLSSLNETLVGRLHDMSAAQSLQMQELFKQLGQSLSTQLSAMQENITTNKIRNDPLQVRSEKKRENIVDNAIRRHIEILCSLAQEKEGRVESEQAQRIIGELQGILSSFNELSGDQNINHHERKRKAEDNDEEIDGFSRKKPQHGALQKLTGMIWSTDVIQLTGQGTTTQWKLPLKAYTNTPAHEFNSESASLSIISATHYHKQSSNITDSKAGGSFSARAMILPRNASFSNKITLSIFQQMTNKGYFSPYPTLTFANVIPNEAPVFEVVRVGDLGELQRMVGTGQISLSDCDPEGRSLLAYAYNHGHPEMCEYLVENGSDVNSLEVGFGVYEGLFRPIIVQQNSNWCELRGKELDRALKCMSLLLHHGADASVSGGVSRRSDDDDDYDGSMDECFIEIIRNTSGATVNILQNILRHDVGFIDLGSQRGHMLINACQGFGYGDFGAVRFMLDQGADPNHRNEWGQTPIHTLLQSSRSGKNLSNALKNVIQAGGDIYAKTWQDEVPSRIAKIEGLWPEWANALNSCGIEQAEIDRMENEALQEVISTQVRTKGMELNYLGDDEDEVQDEDDWEYDDDEDDQDGKHCANDGDD